MNTTLARLRPASSFIRRVLNRPRDESERGQVLVIVGAGLLVMILMVGLVIDVGFAWGQQRDSQNASDSAAEAGATMMAANRFRLRHRAKKGEYGARMALALLAQTDRLLGVILLGNNLINAASAMLTSTFPVAGSSTSNVFPEAAGRHSPLISRPVGTEASSPLSRSAVTAGCAVTVTVTPSSVRVIEPYGAVGAPPRGSFLSQYCSAGPGVYA